MSPVDSRPLSTPCGDAAGIVFAISSLIVMLITTTGCRKSSAAAPAEPKQIMEDFTMTQTESSKTVWQLSAPKASLTLEGDADLERPEILFYKDGKHTSTANATKATVRGGQRNVVLQGDVVITSLQEKTTLRTDRLDYSAAKQMFRTESEVFIERPGAKLKGRGLEADAALENITIFHQRTVIR